MATKYFRAKADKGWKKEDIYSFIKDVFDCASECAGDEKPPKMFPMSKLTDADCQWFVDKEFAIDFEYEEDEAGERDDLAMTLCKRILKRIK